MPSHEKNIVNGAGRSRLSSPSRVDMSTCYPARHQGGSNLYPQSLSIWTDVFPTSSLRQLQEPEPAPCQEAPRSITEAMSLCGHLPGGSYLIKAPLGKWPKCLSANWAPESHPQTNPPWLQGARQQCPLSKEDRSPRLHPPTGPRMPPQAINICKAPCLVWLSCWKGMSESWQICLLSHVQNA